jgi:hypothetical protein
MVNACLGGVGIAQVMAPGELRPLDRRDVSALRGHTSRRDPPAKFRSFIDFCMEMIAR